MFACSHDTIRRPASTSRMVAQTVRNARSPVPPPCRRHLLTNPNTSTIPSLYASAPEVHREIISLSNRGCCRWLLMSSRLLRCSRSAVTWWNLQSAGTNAWTRDRATGASMTLTLTQGASGKRRLPAEASPSDNLSLSSRKLMQGEVRGHMSFFCATLLYFCTLWTTRQRVADGGVRKG